MNERDEALIEALKKSDESKDNLFESWIIDSEEKEGEQGEGKED
jgi:hypothetical protein